MNPARDEEFDFKWHCEPCVNDKVDDHFCLFHRGFVDGYNTARAEMP